MRGDQFDPGFAWWELLIINGITVICLYVAAVPVYTLIAVPNAAFPDMEWLMPDATLHDMAWLTLALTAFIWVTKVRAVFGFHHDRITRGSILPRWPRRESRA